MKNCLLTLIALMAVLLAGVARAADETVLAPINKEIIPGHEKPIPVSLSGFSGEAQEVIQFDLTVQGFSFVSPDAAQYNLSGSANGNLIGRAQDRINKSYLVNKSYTGGTLRQQAHAFVDDFLAALGSMPQASGVALGFDRLVMLASGAQRIDQVVWTPPAGKA